VESRKVCIVSGKRIPFCRSGSNYMGVGNKQLMTTALSALVDSLGLKGQKVGEVVLGAVSKHAVDFSLARECTIDSGLSMSTPATDLQKACGTSLEASIIVANKIALGQIECGIAGGVDTNSDIPVEFKKSFSDLMSELNYSKTLGQKLKSLTKIRLGDFVPVFPAVREPRTGLSMGESCEEMAKTWNITRQAQDELALASHQKAAKAYDEGFFKDMVVPYKGLKRDGILRAETTMDKMAKLKPCFDRSDKGTLTAANSTSLSDGASCVFLCSEDYAREHNLEVKAYLTYAQSAAVDYVKEEGLLMAPAYAVSEMLNKHNLTFENFDFVEIHEAFAAQVLCTLEAWKSEKFCKEKLGRDKALGEIDPAKINVKGSSLALGHPFAATGSRIVMTLAEILNQKGSGRGLISICTAGGMGVTAILEK
jgi:acetyl-CoA C-acetyltransferase